MTDTADLIYNWNARNRRGPLSPLKTRGVSFFDETLRDGIQSPSAVDPPIEDKQALLRLMDRLGIQWADIGLPGAGQRAIEDVESLAKLIRDENLSIKPSCAARTHPNDIRPIIEISQRTGVEIEVLTFLGSSPIRQYSESWDLGRMERLVAEAVKLSIDAGLPASFVTEDTIRSTPESLERLFKTAIDHGARRLVLCDTVGHATPDGIKALVSWCRELIGSMGVEVGLDWHGHNDRGLALPLAILAFELGVDRVHGCALGIGERVGNTSMDLLLLNLDLLGQLDDSRHDLSGLVEYVRTVSEYTGVPIHPSYPLSGHDAFRTATGVHAAAIIKAQNRGDLDLADRVYSSVPARRYGRNQVIEIGHYSGRSNVICWLSQRGIEPVEGLVDAILEKAKTGDHTLTEDEIHSVVSQAR